MIYRYEGRSPKETEKYFRETKIDDNTALWAMRMCWGEGGKKCSIEKASAMLWALMHRWMLWDKKRRYPTYLSLMRAFSQPINPRWQTGGDLAYKYRNRDAGSPERLRRRKYICSLGINMIGTKAPQMESAVTHFRNGELFPPDCLVDLESPRITNWASLPSTPTKFPWGMDINGDWFFEDKRILPGTVVVDLE